MQIPRDLPKRVESQCSEELEWEWGQLFVFIRPLALFDTCVFLDVFMYTHMHTCMSYFDLQKYKKEERKRASPCLLRGECDEG